MEFVPDDLVNYRGWQIQFVMRDAQNDRGALLGGTLDGLDLRFLQRCTIDHQVGA